MTPQQNTDGKFWAYKQVATLPDSTGRYRASIRLFSEMYDWTPEALAETLARANAQNPSILLPAMTRAEWDKLQADIDLRTGYCDESAPDAYMEFGPWLRVA